MTTKIFGLGILVTGVLALSEVPVFAADPQPGATGVVVYVPPKLGAPKGRVGGGARGTVPGIPRLTVLAPDHPGRTVEAQPNLYWYVSRPTNDPVEFTLMSDDQVHPLVEARLADATQAGVHKVSLVQHGFKLSPYSTYRWYVAVVHEPDRRSKDVIAGGVIERIDMPDGLAEQLKNAKSEDQPKIYAGAGIWYDAINALSTLIDASPRDAALRVQRATLLEQVGLLDVAGYDRKEAGGN